MLILSIGKSERLAEWSFLYTVREVNHISNYRQLRLAGRVREGFYMNNPERKIFALALTLVVGGLNVVSSSCSTAEPPQGVPLEFSSQQAASAASLEFSAPEGWIEEKPSSPMRQSQFRLPADAPQGGDAEVAVFTGIGGSVEQNIERWINQFQASSTPQVDRRVVRNFPVTFVDVTGTYNADMMNRGAVPKQDYRMLAAVIEADSAPWFVKLVGPRDTVTRWEPSFTAFVESFR